MSAMLDDEPTITTAGAVARGALVPRYTTPQPTLTLLTFAAGLQSDPGFHVFLASKARHLPAAPLVVLSPDKMELKGGVRVVPCAVGPGKPILTRWQAIAAWLAAATADALVLLIDSRDVVFNADPAPRILELLGGREILFFSEHQKTGDHKWCRNQAALLEGFSATPHALDQPEINGGVIAGRAGALAKFAEDIAFAMGLFTKTNLSDQPVINRWVRLRALGAAHVVAGDYRLYCHGELVRENRWPASAPVPTECAIFHQFDRMPAMRSRYLMEYPQSADLLGKQLVVSHYNEDVAWSSVLFPGVPLLVYSKADKRELEAKVPPGALRLPNVGFEAQTWLHHFAANYDQLAKVMIMLQGHPGAHFRREDEAVRKAVLAINPDSFSFLPLAGSTHGAMQTRAGGPDHVPPKYPSIAAELDRLWRELLGHPPPERWWSFYGGQFAVHRDLVRRRPKEFWQRAAALVKTKNEACVMERMWGALFA